MLSFIPAVSSRDEDLSSKSAQISELLTQNEELARTKVSLEMRALELEEQRDRWNEERAEFTQTLDRLQAQIKVK